MNAIIVYGKNHVETDFIKSVIGNHLVSGHGVFIHENNQGWKGGNFLLSAYKTHLKGYLLQIPLSNLVEVNTLLTLGMTYEQIKEYLND